MVQGKNAFFLVIYNKIETKYKKKILLIDIQWQKYTVANFVIRPSPRRLTLQDIQIKKHLVSLLIK